jgi:hypothetical protein
MPVMERLRQCRLGDRGSPPVFALCGTSFGSVGVSLGGYLFPLAFP